MAIKTIEFKKTEVTANTDSLVELEIEEIDFDSGTVNDKVESISFAPLKDEENVQEREILGKMITNGEEFELSYEEDETLPLESDAAEESDNQKVVIRLNKTSKLLQFQWNSNIFTLKRKYVEESIQEIKDKFTDENIDSEKQNEILEEDWENNYRETWNKLSDSEIEEKKTEAINKINTASNKIAQKVKTPLEEVKDRLEDENVKSWGLKGEAKTSYDKLEKGESISENEREAIDKGIYEKSSEKKITDLTARVDKAIKEKKQEDMETLVTELNSFISNDNYKSKKTEAEALSKKIKKELGKEKNTSGGDNWFSQNWKWAVPTFGGLFAVVIGAVLYFRRNNDTEIE